MNYPEAYVDYLVYFHGVRDYFECHEVLETEWMKAPKGARIKGWRGLIQVAVAFYHWRRGNLKGALRSFQNAEANLAEEQEWIKRLALDPEELLQQIREWQSATAAGKPYQSENLPVTDRDLISLCEQKCKEKGCTYGNLSDPTDIDLINKHEMPDRETVLSKREKKKRGLY